MNETNANQSTKFLTEDALVLADSILIDSCRLFRMISDEFINYINLLDLNTLVTKGKASMNNLDRTLLNIINIVEKIEKKEEKKT